MKLFPYYLFVFLLSFARISESADRVALIVGNGDYQNTSKLTNPTNDAKAVAAMLEKLNFKVITLLDADVDAFYDGIDRFKRESAHARVGLFYFAGHGIEIESRNYLMPVDADLEQSSHLRTQAIDLQTILQEMEDSRIPAKMVILDCCRNNPLTRSWMSTRSLGQGLAAVTDQDIPEATMILFAAKPGQVALDGTGKNSPFTAALLRELTQPKRNAMDAFLAVSDSVVETTESRQEPWVKLDGAGRAFRSFSLVDDAESGLIGTGTRPIEAPQSEPVPEMISAPAVVDSKPKSLTPGMRMVPDHYKTIQSAVDAAVENDVILIKPGIYTEMISIPAKNGIELRGSDRSSVILRVPESANPGEIVTIDSRVAENLKISNISFEFSEGDTEHDLDPEAVPDAHVQIVGGSVEVTNCNFDGGMSLYGVRVLGGKGTIRNCEIRQSVIGIQICNKGVVALVSGCEIEDSIQRSINIFGEADATIERNSLEGAAEVGIAVVGKKTKAIVRSNVIERCGVQGIEVSDGASLVAEGNTCIEHTGAGILALGEGTYAVLRKNKCDRNEQGGIGAIQNARGEMVGNTCNENRIGITLYQGAGFEIRDNRCDFNRASGISIESSDCEVWLTGNQTSNNKENGIAVLAACYAKEFSDNRGSGNGMGTINRNARFTK
mgnify:CR=1 FL=1